MKVGDKVRVVKVPSYLDDEVKTFVGRIGVVDNFDFEMCAVNFNGDVRGFYHNELELVADV